MVNAIKNLITVNGVNYINKHHIKPNIIYDAVIASSNANLFNGLRAKKKIVWSNSVQPFEKFLRKGQLIPFLKHKPIVVTMCNYQYRLRSFITSFYGKDMISLTVDPKFFKEPVDINHIPKKKAIYNIRSNRNLDWLINIWINKIFPQDNSVELHITPGLVDYNDTLLMYYKPYFNYLVIHFNNLAYNYCKNECNGDLNYIERSLHYSTHKLQLIDSVVTKNKTIRDNNALMSAAKVEETLSTLKIYGNPNLELNKNYIVKNFMKDHRIFMMACVAALTLGGKWKIHDPDSIKTSFPKFLTILQNIGAKIN